MQAVLRVLQGVAVLQMLGDTLPYPNRSIVATERNGIRIEWTQRDITPPGVDGEYWFDGTVFLSALTLVTDKSAILANGIDGATVTASLPDPTATETITFVIDGDEAGAVPVQAVAGRGTLVYKTTKPSQHFIEVRSSTKYGRNFVEVKAS